MDTTNQTLDASRIVTVDGVEYDLGRRHVHKMHLADDQDDGRPKRAPLGPRCSLPIK